MKLKSVLISLIIVGVITLGSKGLLHTHQIFAQDQTGQSQDSPSPSPIDPTMLPVDTIFKKERQSQKIEQLLNTYQGQVEQYRKLEREFTISKAQFFQLNTLQSLEEAVVSAKKTMISRTEVFITYFELLHTSLEDTEGVEVSQKAEILKNLETQITVLKDHQKKLNDTADRAGIAQRVQEFKQIERTLSPTAYSAIAVIIIGDLQTVYDKTVLLYADVKKSHLENPTTALRQDERNRAYREVDNEIATINKQLLDIRTAVNNDNFSEQSFQNETRTDLNKTYAQISQVHSFIEELILELT